MALVLVTPPAVEPVSVTEAKTHLRVDGTAEDQYIADLITAAREYVERFTRRALITQTWDLVLWEWPDGDAITIPLPPLQSVASITYKDESGTTYTMPASDYYVDTDSEPGAVVLAPGASWPTVTLYPAAAIRVRFTAGYGGAGTDVPRALRQAILLLVGHLYENREETVAQRLQQIPFGARALMWPYRVLRWP